MPLPNFYSNPFQGFLADDRMLAAAVWRNVYGSTCFDPIYVGRIVQYMRETVSPIAVSRLYHSMIQIAFLDKIDANDILVTGIDVWKPANEIVRKERDSI